MSITQPVRVFVALGIQHAMRMGHIAHLWPAPLYIFPHYLTNGTNYIKTLLNIKCVSSFPTIFV